MYDRNRRISLPKWAADEMNAQDRTIARYRQEVADLKAMLGHEDKPDGSTLGIDYLGDRILWLPPSQRHIAVDVDGFTLRLSTGVGGNGSAATGKGVQVMVSSHHVMLLRPQASNTVHVEPAL